MVVSAVSYTTWIFTPFLCSLLSSLWVLYFLIPLLLLAQYTSSSSFSALQGLLSSGARLKTTHTSLWERNEGLMHQAVWQGHQQGSGWTRNRKQSRPVSSRLEQRREVYPNFSKCFGWSQACSQALKDNQKTTYIWREGERLPAIQSEFHLCARNSLLQCLMKREGLFKGLPCLTPKGPGGQ